MKNNKKIEIAKDFVASHIDNDVRDWQPVGTDDDKKYLLIYSSLKNGQYGTVHHNGSYDDGGNIIYGPSDFYVEIDTIESATNKPVLFEWDYL